MTTPPAEINRATAELVALACAVRPDWEEDFVAGAISAAANDGRTWEQVLTELPRLMVDPAARPRDLTGASRRPRPTLEGDPRLAEGNHRGAEAARAALLASLPRQPGRDDVADAQ